ncbi:MAG: iron ABC transporter permease [Chitinophagales bacterium]
MKLRFSVLVLVLIFLNGLLFLLQLFTGNVAISPAVLLSPQSDDTASIILWQSRFPAAVTALVAGSALAVSGLQMQTLFRNPVAGPYVLGISSGAQLGVAVFVLLNAVFAVSWINDLSITVAAATGAFALFSIVLVMVSRHKGTATLLVIGLLLTGMCGAIVEIIESHLTDSGLRRFLFWSFGNLQGVTLQKLPILISVVAVALLASAWFIKPLNVMALGDDYAASSGVDVIRTRKWVTWCTCLLAGTVTAFCGPIAFLGLAVPHAARIFTGSSDHYKLMPVTLLFGALICGFCNLLSHIPVFGILIPLNAITSLIGAPFVIWLLLKMKTH